MTAGASERVLSVRLSMASPRTRRVLAEMRPKDENNVSQVMCRAQNKETGSRGRIRTVLGTSTCFWSLEMHL